MRSMIRLCSKVLPKESLLVFDRVGNTKENKQSIPDIRLHYLILKAKKRKDYTGMRLPFTLPGTKTGFPL